MRQMTGSRSFRTVAVMVAACAGLLSSCGDPTDHQPDQGDSASVSGLSDGPPWAPNLSRVDSILDPTVMAITPHFGRGIIDGPTWQPDFSTIERLAGPPNNSVRDRAPVGEPNWDALTTASSVEPYGPR